MVVSVGQTIRGQYLRGGRKRAYSTGAVGKIVKVHLRAIRSKKKKLPASLNSKISPPPQQPPPPKFLFVHYVLFNLLRVHSFHWPKKLKTRICIAADWFLQFVLPRMNDLNPIIFVCSGAVGWGKGLGVTAFDAKTKKKGEKTWVVYVASVVSLFSFSHLISTVQKFFGGENGISEGQWEGQGVHFRWRTRVIRRKRVLMRHLPNVKLREYITENVRPGVLISGRRNRFRISFRTPQNRDKVYFVQIRLQNWE